MLTKRKNFMTAGNCRVKKLTRAALVTLGLLTTAAAPAAFAYDTATTSRIVSVKIKLTELQAEDGTQAVYKKLQKRAMSFCRSDRSSLQYLGQSVAECTADLMEQFVESADIDVLETYHLSQQPATATTQLALNK